MGILSVNLNDIKLDDANCYEDDPKIIIHIRHLVWHNKFKQRETFLKNKKGINVCSVAFNKMVALVNIKRCKKRK